MTTTREDPSTSPAPTDEKHHISFHGWHRHPGVRSGDGLSLGERAADKMRNSMGSWFFVFAALIFLGIWMAANNNTGFDKYPFILLNLVLSCLAALQGAILLIAAKRSDQVASELAQHDYDADCRSRELLETLMVEFATLKQQHEELHQHMDRVMTSLDCHPHSNVTAQETS
ncbi:DUF1003 domain-containing protein [Actinoallomurus sp. NPDC050550]|uniref:DUF1003 domain-containing protein n=1 Tax=Actinoallomurus sp. NPDC050550 TaxID=3154937 RepID=UPI0034051F1D